MFLSDKTVFMKLSTELKISIIAILILVASIWGFSFLRGVNIFKPNEKYYAVFKRIDGIKESGNVLVRGYNAGNIMRVEYDHKGSGAFVVMFVLNDGVRIPIGSEISVKNAIAKLVFRLIPFSKSYL